MQNQDHLFPLWEHKQETIDYVLNNFDFAAVHEFMVKEKWEWGDPVKNSLHIPTLNEIKELLKEKLTNGYFFGDKYGSNLGCGGFQIEYIPNWLSIRFGYSSLFLKNSEIKQITHAMISDWMHVVTKLDIGKPTIKVLEFKKGMRRFGITIGDYYVRSEKPYTEKEAKLIQEFLEKNMNRFNTACISW